METPVITRSSSTAPDSSPVLKLSAAHYQLLHTGSAITETLIRQRGYQTLSQPDDLVDHGFSKPQSKMAPGLLIPLHNVHGQSDGWQFRPDAPRLVRGKTVKYETATGATNMLDIHPSVFPLLQDPAVPLWLIEGVRKGDALASHGICALAFPGGVWGFRGTNAHGGKVVLPDWQYVPLNGRLVYVAYDADARTKSGVASALKALYTMLTAKGATPAIVQWPDEYCTADKKWGVDDFFAAGHTLDELRAMIPPVRLLPARLPRTHAAPDPRPVVQLTKASVDVPLFVAQAETLLTTLPDAPVVFQRAGKLCTLTQGAPAPRFLSRDHDAPTIAEIPKAHLWDLLCSTAVFQKYDGRSDGWVDTHVPLWLIEALMGKGSWTFPPLEGTIFTPTLRLDGSILETPGYDQDTGLFYHANGTTYPPLLPHPTREDARGAVNAFRGVLQDFRFVGNGFASVLAAVLSLVCRHAIDGCVPLFAVRSTTPGSGKGYLIDVIALTATGRCAPRWAPVYDDAEERKRIFTLALSGDPLIHIDNVTHPLGSEVFSYAITARTFNDRLLGGNQKGEAPMHMVWFASGNNLQFKDKDTLRRCVVIDIDPLMEHPEERTDFAYPNLLEHVRQARPALVWAALTIVQAYCVAGRPQQPIAAYGSFEAWNDLIRAAVVWVGEADPLAERNMIAAEGDQASETLETLMTAWEACYKDRDVAIQNACRESKALAAQPHEPENEWDALRAALCGLDPAYRGYEPNTAAIGNSMKALAGRIIGGKRFVRSQKKTKHGRTWKVESLSPLPGKRVGAGDPDDSGDTSPAVLPKHALQFSNSTHIQNNTKTHDSYPTKGMVESSGSPGSPFFKDFPPFTGENLTVIPTHLSPQGISIQGVTPDITPQKAESAPLKHDDDAIVFTPNSLCPHCGEATLRQFKTGILICPRCQEQTVTPWRDR